MKVTVERGALFKALGHAASVVERKNTIPILSNLLLEAVGDELRLTATDLELQLQLPVPASVGTEGAVTVQAALLQSIVREIPDGQQIELTVDDVAGLKLLSGRSRYKLQTLPPTDFPVMVVADEAVVFEMPAAALRGMLAKTQFAMSSDPARYFLNAVCLAAHAGALVAAATDGAALAHADIEAPEGSTEIPETLLPRKTVGELADLMGDAEGTIEVAVTPKQIKVTLGDIA
jgi:DNA polymerase-3 subunit beta